MYYLIKFHNITVLLHFEVNNKLKVALVNKRHFFQNHKTSKKLKQINNPTPNFWMICISEFAWCVKIANFYVPYSTFHRSFKEKCPLSGAKTQVQYVNPGTFLLCSYRHVYFYYIASGMYVGGSEFKYPETRYPKNECPIVLELCPTPNPSLNLPDSVNKCKTDVKTYLLMHATMLYELLYMQIWTVLSNHSYTRLESELLISQVHLCTSWATEQTYRLWKPRNMKLDMYDANVQKHQFLNLPAY